ncbi:MAG: DNA topoisomerase IV subunit A, partial [Actinomycetaceae bacterium]|nr:DNA topoisomerase IV subunit A [Actinomycetaceae bacterium]
MAKTPQSRASEEKIIDIDVSEEMRTSFLEYSYSVIYARALPDARDGLKPVQRRILFQMDQMGLRPDHGHVKSSRVVGDVMGRLHPHGDSAIYDAMVRLAQPFTMRLPLVDGHGNFGSLDDGPAAARYTEVRMAPAAVAMNASLAEDVVDMVPNYDNTLMQPEVLPAAIPNLLVNGTSGIAVGMATNMPPHNLNEVIAGARHLLMHPDATLGEIMTFIPGPDLPEGGKIVGLDGIREAYATGRGIFRTRATASIENVTSRKRGIVFTELPYLTGPEKIIEKIKDAVQSKKIQGISAVQNLTDRHHGMRLVVEVKNSFNPQAVLAALYQHTPLEESFGINNVALVEGQPQTLGLIDLLRVYVDHRISVTRRRSAFRLKKAQDRLHLVEGLLIAILDIDDVIEIIRSSEDAAEASRRLQQVFDLTEAQADYILELRLRRLTKLSQLELEAERDDLRRQIADLEAILSSDARLKELVSQEMAEVAEQFGTPRRTLLVEATGEELKAAANPHDLKIADDPCQVIYTGSGRIAKILGDSPLHRSGPRARYDDVVAVISTTNYAEIGVVTSTGNIHRLKVLDIPQIPRTDAAPGAGGGVKLADVIVSEGNERPLMIVSLDPGSAPIAFATGQGKVKRLQPSYPNKEVFDVMTLADGDEIIGAAHAPDDTALVLITTDAQLLRFSADAVRPQGRSGQGIAGIKLSNGARVLGFGVVPAED